MSNKEEVQSIVNDYRENANSNNKQDWAKQKEEYQRKKEYNLNKRFIPYKKSKWNIRLLPASEGKKLWENTGFFYNIKPVGKAGTEVLWSPINDGESSCIEVRRKELYNQDRETEAKELPYHRKYHHVYVIDRDDETKGVQIWQFPHNIKGDGIMDKIITLSDSLDCKIWDIEDGVDLVLQQKPTSTGRSYKFDMFLPRTETRGVITKDKEQLDKWLKERDSLRWEDIYSFFEKRDDTYAKGHYSKEFGEDRLSHKEYLEYVLENRIPYYSKDLKTTVIPDPVRKDMPTESEKTEILDSYIQTTTPPKESNYTNEETVEEDSFEDNEDDLPF